MKHFLTLALVVVSRSAYSQTKNHPSGEIKGTVADENRNAVSAATVCVVPQDISLDSITTPVRLAPGQEMHMDIPLSKQ